MYPVIMSNEMTERLPYGNTMESSHIRTLQLPGPIKQARQIQILLKNEDIPINIIMSLM